MIIQGKIIGHLILGDDKKEYFAPVKDGKNVHFETRKSKKGIIATKLGIVSDNACHCRKC